MDTVLTADLVIGEILFGRSWRRLLLKKRLVL